MALWPREAWGFSVELRAVGASAAAQEGHPLEAAVDGLLMPGNGWRIREGQFQKQFAVFATDQPVTAAMCQLQLFFLSPTAHSHFGNFQIDVTTDEKPVVSGRWMPLVPELVIGGCPDGTRTSGVLIRIETNCPVSVVTVHARVPFAGITGFRLFLHLTPTDPATDPAGNPPRSIGRAADGGFVLTEFRVEAIPQRSSNIALGRQVYCSRGVAPGLPSRNLTDGFFSTYSHPDPATGGEGAFFELDLGQMTPLDHIVVRGRKDGAEADRLGAYRVQTFTEPVGLPWQTQWQARRRTDGSLMAAGSADVIRARDGKGTFSGRRIRIHNESGRNPQPQIAEVEVYPALFPQAQDWLADDRALGPGSEVAVPVGARQLRFTIDCGAFANLADAVIYRWRLSGWRDEWRETTADGRVLISPAPPAGLYTLHLQARHSDGVWDESGAPVSLRIALPWWRNPPLLAAGVSGVLVLAAALWWRVKTSVMKRRLAVAEQHLSLQRERLRIARDLHDEMGANLTQIALLSELTRCDFDNPGQAKGHMDEVFRTARSLTRSLDEIVWAVNPANDTLERFVAHLCTYAPRFLQSAGVGCRLEVPEELPDIPLSAGVRHHLHLSVKESLHNIVKHAQATEVWLRLRLAPATLTLIIEDNGRGIPTAAPAPGADGLGNLRQRMCEIGGSFEQRNRDGKGTIITLVAPLKREGL